MRSDVYIEEYCYYCENIFSILSKPVEASSEKDDSLVGKEEGSCYIKKKTPNAILLMFRHEGEIAEVWFPKKAVKVTGDTFRVETWFFPSYLKNLRNFLDKQIKEK